MGAGQGLQAAVLLAYGLAAQAAVELRLLHALVEAHNVGSQLPLQPLAATDALAQAVQFELAQLGRGKTGERVGNKTKVSAGEVQSQPFPCSADGPRKNVLLSLTLFPLGRMKGLVRSEASCLDLPGDSKF